MDTFFAHCRYLQACWLWIKLFWVFVHLEQHGVCSYRLFFYCTLLYRTNEICPRCNIVHSMSYVPDDSPSIPILPVYSIMFLLFSVLRPDSPSTPSSPSITVIMINNDYDPSLGYDPGPYQLWTCGSDYLRLSFIHIWYFLYFLLINNKFYCSSGHLIILISNYSYFLVITYDYYLCPLPIKWA